MWKMKLIGIQKILNPTLQTKHLECFLHQIPLTIAKDIKALIVMKNARNIGKTF